MACNKQFLLFSQCFLPCIPFPDKPWFLRVCSTSFLENTVGKGKIVHNEQFLLFPQCLLSSRRTLHHFHQTENCRLQTLSIWTGLKFCCWERVIALIFHFKCTFKCRLQFVSIWTSLKFCHLLLS